MEINANEEVSHGNIKRTVRATDSSKQPSMSPSYFLFISLKLFLRFYSYILQSATSPLEALFGRAFKVYRELLWKKKFK